MMGISNYEFLKAIFGENHQFAHVTSFHDDPTNIDQRNRMRCWAGDYFKNTNLLQNSNQYFTVSIFNPDETGKARRRKHLFLATYVIVADDVREKLNVEQVQKLPPPTYKMETSPGSEQWGWILDYPCTDRDQVENLLDGLVEKGLAPDGKDPGMKGVTRYVRLPEGVNTKASKLVNGKPVQCKILEWCPWNRTAIANLARPFNIDLNATRKGIIESATGISDHPIVNIPHVVRIKETLSGGRYDITCPWVDYHTNADDSGTAVFTNSDGSIGFKCHHGSCQDRTGKHLLEFIERVEPGFGDRLNHWKVVREFGQPVLDFMGTVQPVQTARSELDTVQQDRDKLMGQLKTTPLGDSAVLLAYGLLKLLDPLDHGTRLKYWDEIRDHMQWSKQDLNTILEQQRKHWYKKKESDIFKQYVYVSEQNQFYNPVKRLWLSPEAFQNAHSHIDEGARAEALIEGRVEKVDRFTYTPKMPEIFEESGVRYVNGWCNDIETGVPGDVSRWLDHFNVLGWSVEKDHMLKWMAFTLRHPEQKINHILLLGGGEGNGKDFILYPLARAMGENYDVIDGDNLLGTFNEYLLRVKYLHINEVELGTHAEAKTATRKLKPLASCPPYTLSVDMKYLRPVKIKNIVNVSMTSNSAMPLKLSGDSRRYFAVWTDVSIRGDDGQVTKYWSAYWTDRWSWIRDQEGWKACVNYLMTQVDLSDFDPGTVPVLTDFVRDIQEASEDPVVTVIKEFVKRRLSYFQSDLLTSQDIHSALKTIAVNNVSIDLKMTPNPNTIGKIMKQNGLGVQLRAWKGADNMRVWVVRDRDRYGELSGTDLYDEYHRVMGIIKTGHGLSVAG